MKLFLRQLHGELWKLFARKRTYIGFGAFLALEIVVLLIFQFPKVQRSWRRLIERAGFGFEDYFSGITLAFQILLATTSLLGALYVALVAGDVVAKEVEDGTMRMTLCRPVTRLRVLVLKYLACVIYTFALVIFIGLSALLVGTLRQGIGGFFVFQPFENLFALYDFGPGLARYLGSLPLLGLGLISVASLAFALSCFNMKPAAATICTLSYFFADSILRRIPYFDSIQEWFITSRIESWYNIFRSPLPLAAMVEDYIYLFAVNATVLIIGALHFQRRDFKS